MGDSNTRRSDGKPTGTGASGGLWTPANVVTCVRVACTPLWLLVAELGVSPWLTLVLFLAISLTDSLDGYLARSRNEVTDFGKFLDPIADKLVVIVAICYLLERGLTSSWVMLIVVMREFLVSGLRMVLAAKGEVVAASWIGKWKTATTMLALSLLLLSEAFNPLGMARTAGNVVMVVAMALTLWSGVDYFVKGWPYLSGER